MERTDDSGRWVSDDGVSWSLVEPSQDWDKGGPDPDPDPAPAPAPDVVAALEAADDFAEFKALLLPNTP